MSKVSQEVKKIFEWIDNQPEKEGWIIAKTPIKASSFTQMKHGSYKPGARMLKDCFRAIEEYDIQGKGLTRTHK